MSQSNPTPDTTARTETAETVTVPARMPLTQGALRALEFICGTDDPDIGNADVIGTLWVGELTNDDGSKEYGLNVTSSEYPEDGSEQIVALASPQHPVGVREALEAIRDLWLAPGADSVKVMQAKDIALAALSHPPAQDAPGAVGMDRGPLYDSRNPNNNIAALGRVSPPLPEADGEVVDTDRVERLKAAVEGECEGLAITDEQAVAILRYVDEAAREKAEQVAAGLREATQPFAQIADEYDDSEDDKHEVWKDCGPNRVIRTRLTLGKCRAARAALRASTEEGKTATPSVKEEEAGGDVGLSETLDRLRYLAQSRYELLRECEVEFRAHGAVGIADTIKAALKQGSGS